MRYHTAIKLKYSKAIYYWENADLVFDDYIKYLYDFKKNATKGTAQHTYTLAKRMMNGLYGKTLFKSQFWMKMSSFTKKKSSLNST